MGNNKAATLLQQTLDEEAETDQSLTNLAESINVEAENPDDAEEEEEVSTTENKQKIGATVRVS